MKEEETILKGKETMSQNAIPARTSAAPVPADGRFDLESDIVVVGGGGGGLSAALFARWLGDQVILLEKAPELGGTTKKAAFWYWVPNNAAMRELGLEDREEDFLRYVARLSRPDRYDPSSPTLGLDDWELASFRAIYESASSATELLRERGALPYRHVFEAVDYWAEIPEDKAPKGRVLLPQNAKETMADGGEVGIRTLSEAAKRDGIDIRTGHRVQRLVMADGAVVGVEATTADSATVRVRARKAVIFASGGFTHDVELRKNFLSVPVVGGCAALTNEGDFVRIASRVGAQLWNMNYAWMCPVPLEKAVARQPGMSGMFSVNGDSMIWVDKTGRRVVNEKLPYNEQAQNFFRWDSTKGEYPNLVLIMIWDQRSQDHSADHEYGRVIVPQGEDDAHVIRGNTLEELATAITKRLDHYKAHIGDIALSDDFVTNLAVSIEHFNELARKGIDEDLGRGEKAVQLLFNGPVKEEPGRKNPTMWPIADSGPYYAALIAGGTLDTKGGPKTTPDGKILDDLDQPVPGLYGVGNCVASASGRAYWAGGGTLGPILAFAYRAAQAAHEEPVREPSTTSSR